MSENTGGLRVKKIRDFRKPIMICAALSSSRQKRCKFYKPDVHPIFTWMTKCAYLSYDQWQHECTHPLASKLIRPEVADDAEK